MLYTKFFRSDEGSRRKRHCPDEKEVIVAHCGWEIERNIINNNNNKRNMRLHRCFRLYDRCGEVLCVFCYVPMASIRMAFLLSCRFSPYPLPFSYVWIPSIRNPSYSYPGLSLNVFAYLSVSKKKGWKRMIEQNQFHGDRNWLQKATLSKFFILVLFFILYFCHSKSWLFTYDHIEKAVPSSFLLSRIVGELLLCKYPTFYEEETMINTVLMALCPLWICWFMHVVTGGWGEWLGRILLLLLLFLPCVGSFFFALRSQSSFSTSLSPGFRESC